MLRCIQQLVCDAGCIHNFTDRTLSVQFFHILSRLYSENAAWGTCKRNYSCPSAEFHLSIRTSCPGNWLDIFVYKACWARFKTSTDGVDCLTNYKVIWELCNATKIDSLLYPNTVNIGRRFFFPHKTHISRHTWFKLSEGEAGLQGGQLLQVHWPIEAKLISDSSSARLCDINKSWRSSHGFVSATWEELRSKLFISRTSSQPKRAGRFSRSMTQLTRCAPMMCVLGSQWQQISLRINLPRVPVFWPLMCKPLVPS
jgi:hypothetical protein